MKKNFTYYSKTVLCIALLLCLLVFSTFFTKLYAQCTNSLVLYTEDFGTGTTAAQNPDISGLTYQATGPLVTAGTYRVINNTQQNPAWHASEDFTHNDINGRMLVANGQAGVFYMHQIDRPGGFVTGAYTGNLFLMNLTIPGTCTAPLLPVITMNVEYLSAANTWLPLGNSPYTASPVDETIDPLWIGIGATFNIPPTGAFLVKSIRITLSEGTAGGCGNSFAIDDITVAQCTAGGPLPVVLLNFNASQKGSGVGINWATSQELNSKSFSIEKSADGNSNWSAIASINATGNSSVVKNYGAFDPSPFKGVSYYRLKQISADGNFAYSKIVSVKLNLDKTGVSVYPNPFHGLLTVDFLSTKHQDVSARLTDITGKQVAIQKWSVNAGSSRKDFSNAEALQKGIYILTISNDEGEILYNNKLIRQ